MDSSFRDISEHLQDPIANNRLTAEQGQRLRMMVTEALQDDILPFPLRLNAGSLGVFQHIQESRTFKDGTSQQVKRARFSPLPKQLKTIALESAFLLIYAIMIEDPMTLYAEKFTMNDVRSVFRKANYQYKNTKVHDVLRKVVQEYEVEMNESMQSDARNGTDRHDEMLLDFGMATSINMITFTMVRYESATNKTLRQPPKLKEGFGVEQVPIDDPWTRNSHLIWRFTRAKLKQLKERYESEAFSSTTNTPFTLPGHVIHPKCSKKNKKNE